ncbi:MAG: serine/threonine-protein kinase [Desulfobacterales bacterium]
MNYGRYQITGEIGRGTMGVVYEAHDPQIDRRIALKVLRQDWITSEEIVQRFIKEARAIGRLSHPKIVTVYDVGQDHGTIYIAMEYLDGQPLNDIIREGRLPMADNIIIAIQVAEALDYAHQKGIVHRDIKPGNIIFISDKLVKVTDFGIARIEDPAGLQQTQAGEILGTPMYMSPEQVLGQPVDGRSDIYALGVILYELVTGQRPFKGNNLASIFHSITHDVPPAPDRIQTSLPPDLASAIMKAMDKKPGNRFQNGGEMIEALRGCLQALRSGKADAPPRKRMFGVWISLGVTMVLLLIAIGGGLFYFRPATSTPDPNANGNPHLAKQVLLRMNSVPPGAQVIIEGSLRGTTPIDLEIPSGKYEVQLNLDNYLDWKAQLDLTQGDDFPVSVRLRPATP